MVGRCPVSASRGIDTKGNPARSGCASTRAFVFKRSFIRINLNCKRTVLIALIGYARVSTEDQTPLPQADELRAVGCRDIHQEQASGASRTVSDNRLLAIVAGIDSAAPDTTLQAICNRLEAMREPTARGRTSWQPSSVRMLLERAKARGLI